MEVHRLWLVRNMAVTASYAEIHVQHGLRNELVKHAVLRGWLGPLLLLWAGGAAFLLLFWALPVLALAWSAVALLAGALMVVNELTSGEVTRGALAASLERNLKIAEMGSPLHQKQLTQNVGTFARIAVRVHAIGPGRHRDRYLAHSLDNMHGLLSTQSEAAHRAEVTRELELSAEICQEFSAAWEKLDEQALDGVNPGPRFAMDFQRATLEVLDNMRVALDSREQKFPPLTLPAVKPIERKMPSTLGDKERNELERMTVMALKKLKDPAALARSGLIDRLQHTLAAGHAAGSGSTSQYGFLTPLAQGHLLGTVIVAAIERFSQAGQGAGGGPEALQYLILHDEYVLRRTITAITTRHIISESQLHRHRRQGISALAADLAAQEEHLARQADGGR